MLLLAFAPCDLTILCRFVYHLSISINHIISQFCLLFYYYYQTIAFFHFTNLLLFRSSAKLSSITKIKCGQVVVIIIGGAAVLVQ